MFKPLEHFRKLVSKQNPPMETSDGLFRDPLELIFPKRLKLLPQVNEVYEIQLAYMEQLTLTDDELVERGAFFAKVGDRFTNHFLLCRGEPLQVSNDSSIRLKTFFEANQFKT
jgi:hypothetical protein